MVMLPVLPDWTVMARAIIYAPLVSKLALLEPVVLPNNTALVALPSAPELPEGAAAPSISVPASTVVVPV